tara:strand:- start:2901 stop:3266 length:366 start_codon:yes stop_codon:yes gene_type:complete
MKRIWSFSTLFFLFSCAQYSTVANRTVTKEEIISRNIIMVSDPKLLESLIYINEYITLVPPNNDYEEIQNLIQKDLVRHGWSNVIVYVEEVKSGYREVNLRRNMVIDRGKTVKVSIYNKTD